MRWTLATLIALLLTTALAACGSDEPGHTPVTPASDFSSPEDGIVFRAPKAATLDTGKDEQVAVLRRGESTLVVSRFPRPGKRLPRSEKEVQRAAGVLAGEYLRLDPGSAARSTTADIADRPAAVVEVSGKKTTEHVHFYEYGAEIVVDMVAPASDVKRARFTLFDPVLSTLKIMKPQD